ncbi:hypothetical protein H920_12724 [Fukomys damarensis]|uniref:Uncharacterized protein n=1 Tax=Fukomys damarensis TaxID=885580 RepID=A0A091DSP6_FUKDA|nr:hypothetical protein H920_12724 [Fukomys damarensis]
MRSKAQILALLKSTPATICEEPEAELPRCSLQMQTPPVCGVGLERCTEVIGTEGPHCQQQPENAVGSRSRWAMYLSPLSSRAAASATGRDDMERQLAVQENDMNLNLEDLLVQKRMQAFGTCAEKGKKYHEDEPVDTDEYGNQEEKLEIPSFCGSSSLLVSCSSVGKGGLLLEAGICENKLAHFSGNDQRCTGEAARGVSTLGPPGQECQFAMWSLPASRHLQAESSVSHDIVDKVSESNTVSESLGSVQDPGGNGTQPFLEVTFNLSNFETSDTEENAQESSISQDAGIWVRGVLGNGNSCIQKPREGPSCQEINSETLPHLMSVGDKWTEKCFVKESLSKFCDKTCVGLDMGPCEGGNTGEAIAEDSISAAQQCSSPSTAGSVDGYVDSKEDANGSVQNIGSHCDFALLSSKSKGTEADLHTPDFLNIVTNQTSKNNDLLFHIQTLPFILGCDLDKDAQQVFPPVSDDENSIQGLDSSQDHSESAALGKSNFQVCDSLPNPQETKQCIYRDTEAYIPECEHLGRSPSLFYDHNQIQTARNGSQSWNNPRNSSELSGIANNISFLKSLSGPSTALESLEMLQKGNIAFPQQGALQAEEPEGRTEG